MGPLEARSSVAQPLTKDAADVGVHAGVTLEVGRRLPAGAALVMPVP